MIVRWTGTWRPDWEAVMEEALEQRDEPPMREKEVQGIALRAEESLRSAERALLEQKDGAIEKIREAREEVASLGSPSTNRNREKDDEPEFERKGVGLVSKFQLDKRNRLILHDESLQSIPRDDPRDMVRMDWPKAFQPSREE